MKHRPLVVCAICGCLGLLTPLGGAVHRKADILHKRQAAEEERMDLMGPPKLVDVVNMVKDTLQDSGNEGETGPFMKQYLKVIDQAVAGDHQGLIQDMLNNQDLDMIFGEPDLVKAVLDNVPGWQAIKGIEDIRAKGDKLTIADGARALKLIRKFGAVAMDKMAEFTGSDTAQAFGQIMQDYANHPDPELQELFRRVEMGDEEAGRQLHMWITNDQFGGLLDVAKLGSDGKEPQFMKDLRREALEDPLFASMFESVSEAMDYLDDPLAATEQILKMAKG